MATNSGYDTFQLALSPVLHMAYDMLYINIKYPDQFYIHYIYIYICMYTYIIYTHMRHTYILDIYIYIHPVNHRYPQVSYTHSPSALVLSAKAVKRSDIPNSMCLSLCTSLFLVGRIAEMCLGQNSKLLRNYTIWSCSHLQSSNLGT